MKNVILIAATFLCSSVFAQNPVDLINSLMKNVETMNSAYTGDCNSSVDEDIPSPKLQCLFLTTNDKNLFLTLAIIYGDGTRNIDGYRVIVEWGGPADTQPRMSGGN